MGCFGSPGCKGGDEKLQKKRSDAIDRQLQKDRVAYLTGHHLMLVGDAESGKSTIIKQMKILHVNGFSEKERREKINDIKKNIRDAICIITRAMSTLTPSIPLEKAENRMRVDYIQDVASGRDFDFPTEFYDHTEALWKDQGVRATFDRANEYQLSDCAKYFLDQVHVIMQPDYTPTEQDILHCKMSTSAMFEAQFVIDKVNFHIYRAGLRHERYKWSRCLRAATAFIFVVACSSYDVVVGEDRTQNSLWDSICLFKMIWNNRTLCTTSIILFLNKQDLLAEKILGGKAPLEDYFADFSHYVTPPDACPDAREHTDVSRAKYFIRDEFLRISTASESKIHRCYPHFTCAVDTQNIKRVFDDCRNYDCRDLIERMNSYQNKLL